MYMCINIAYKGHTKWKMIRFVFLINNSVPEVCVCVCVVWFLSETSPCLKFSYCCITEFFFSFAYADFFFLIFFSFGFFIFNFLQCFHFVVCTQHIVNKGMCELWQHITRIKWVRSGRWIKRERESEMEVEGGMGESLAKWSPTIKANIKYCQHIVET